MHTGSGFRAIVLAGGRGTRLSPFTYVLPKPLLPIGERPILDIVLAKLAAEGCARATLSVGYLGHFIETYCGTGEAWGIDIDYVREGEPLGTVGAIALIDDLAQEPFLVMNGDVLTDFSLRHLMATHSESGAEITIGAHRRRVKEELGVLEADSTGRLLSYQEKPEREFLVSMGIYAFNPSCVRHIIPGDRLDFPDLVLRLLDAGAHVQTLVHDGHWLDIGRHDDFARANEEYASGEMGGKGAPYP